LFTALMVRRLSFSKDSLYAIKTKMKGLSC
jgi:hypothetical protein